MKRDQYIWIAQDFIPPTREQHHVFPCCFFLSLLHSRFRDVPAQCRHAGLRTLPLPERHHPRTRMVLHPDRWRLDEVRQGHARLAERGHVPYWDGDHRLEAPPREACRRTHLRGRREEPLLRGPGRLLRVLVGPGCPHRAVANVSSG